MFKPGIASTGSLLNVLLLQMMREANDKVGPQYQRMTWDALRKSLNGLINKVNVKNIKEILPEIFSEVQSATAQCQACFKSHCFAFQMSHAV